MKLFEPALFRLLFLCLALAGCLVVRSAQAADISLPTPPTRPEVAQGVALGLHFQDPEASYEGYLWEIARTGADTVSLVVSWSQVDIRATELAPRAGETPPDEGVRRAIISAHKMGLKVLLFPIIMVEQRGRGEWRGKLAPTDRDRWYASYRRFLLHYATIAAECGAEQLSVGSELGSMQVDAERWRGLIGEVRAVYGGRLIYSANWDDYDSVPFWRELDAVGVTGYYELVRSGTETPAVAALVNAWQPIVADLRRLSAQVERPVVLTEVGYTAQSIAARHPWDYTRAGKVDLGAQERLYRALYLAWSEVPELGGLYIWNWFGDGGGGDNGYTPRGKPSEKVIRHWFGAEQERAQ
jgi:hypothetical protein